MKYRVFIDGAARGNPGPGGMGIVIYEKDNKKPVREIKCFLGEKTNNQAEYLALIRALEELLSLGAEEARIYSDSQLMVRQMKGEYRVKNERLRSLYRKARDLSQKIPEIELEFINREKNKEADKLANMGIDEALD